jgi:hypothetical protein
MRAGAVVVAQQREASRKGWVAWESVVAKLDKTESDRRSN